MIRSTSVRVSPPVLCGIYNVPCPVKQTIPTVHKDLVIRGRWVGAAEDFNAIREVTGNTVKRLSQDWRFALHERHRRYSPDRVPYNRRRGTIYRMPLVELLDISLFSARTLA